MYGYADGRLHDRKPFRLRRIFRTGDHRCSGGDECKKALQLLKLGRLPEDFVEGMVCEGGCIGGPSRHKQENELKRNREALLKKADDRKVLDNLAQYPMDLFSMFRDGHIGEEWIEWKKELKEKAEAQAADAPQS